VCIVCTAEPAHATSAESPGAVGRRSNGSTADGPSSPGASGREARSPSSGSATVAATTTTTNSGDSSAAQGQLNKLKRFLATVQQFADDIAPDIGDRVRTLVLALVVSIRACFRHRVPLMRIVYKICCTTLKNIIKRVFEA